MSIALLGSLGLLSWRKRTITRPVARELGFSEADIAVLGERAPKLTRLVLQDVSFTGGGYGPASEELAVDRRQEWLSEQLGLDGEAAANQAN